ncbi:MAG: DUF885 family protein, partial [Gammaproteobacteria bacterium]|nr:DUF885 family protein [Gammaproteobacteria bacterium]
MTINEIADRYYAFILQATPEVSYFSGVAIAHHDGISDNSPQGLARIQSVEDGLLPQLHSLAEQQQIGTTEWITHAYLLQKIQSDVALRACRMELWNISQMGGWHSGYAQIARLQPVGTALLRAESLARWAKFPAFVDQEIINLKMGLQAGYSAPKAVVRRVIGQIDGLLDLDTEQSPFFAPAVKDNNDEFVESTRQLVESGIYPALQRYRKFLASSYMGAAREALSVTENPGGRECYEASLRRYT